MIRKILLAYHWFALSLITITFGALDVYSVLSVGSHWNYVNNDFFGYFIILIAILLSIVYFPWPTTKYKSILAQTQTICIAAMTFIWISISLAYLTESNVRYVGVLGLIITSQTLVQAYIEPYRNNK